MATQEVGIFRSRDDAFPTVQVDVVVSENHSAENTVTETPIEDGSPLSNHVIIKPDIVEISCEVSNYDGAKQPLSGERAKTAWQQLKYLRNARELLIIATQHEIYEDMMITAIGAEHVQGFTGAVRLTARFQKIHVARANARAITEPMLAGGNPFAQFNIPICKIASDEVDAGTQLSITRSANPAAINRTAMILAAKIAPLNFPEAKKLSLLEKIRAVLALCPLSPEGAMRMASQFGMGVLIGAAPGVMSAVNLALRSYYTYKSAAWMLDLYDSSGNRVLLGRTMTPGQDVLMGFDDLKASLGSIIMVDLKGTQGATPTALGNDENAEAVIALFPPGVYESIELDLIGTSPKPLNFEFSDLGFTIGTPS